MGCTTVFLEKQKCPPFFLFALKYYLGPMKEQEVSHGFCSLLEKIILFKKYMLCSHMLTDFIMVNTKT